MLRVHDVLENRAALAVFMALKGAAAPPPASESNGDGRARVVRRARRQCRRQGEQPAPGFARDRGRAGRRTDGGLPPLPHRALGQDRPGLVRQRLRAWRGRRLEPEALLERVKRLEVELGREPAERWGPRVIDIDLIAYGDVTLKTERLTLPHPELFNRAFVLVPLAEIAPDLVIAGVRIGEAAARLGAEADEIVPLD